MQQMQKSFKKGFKYRIYPNTEQIDLFEKTFGCCRYVWNKALSEAKQEYEYYLVHKTVNAFNSIVTPNVSGCSFVNRLTNYKNDPSSLWLNDVSAVSLQQTMLHLGAAFSTFFKSRKGYPRFKKKHNHQSFSLTTDAFRFKDNQLFIAKSKDLLIVNFTRQLPSEPTIATVSKTPTGKYYISFTCEYIPEKTNGKEKIGIDLGLKDFLVTSDGLRIPNPKYYSKYQKQLKRKQQALSRKIKGSKNCNKARQRVALHHEKITNCRTDFLHKLSRKLVNENQVIGLEKLKVKNMVKNHKLAKSISDVAWSRFCSMVQYKARESQHCSIVYMDCWYP